MASTSATLAQMPPAPRRLTVAVYDFPDLTGQRKPTNGVVSDLSTAVTQGSSSIVIEALKSAGGGSLFDVVDRTRDADQVREGTIIAGRAAVVQRRVEKAAPLVPNLRPAEYIVNGGVIAFERSILTNNNSVSILGFGGSKSILRNYVSVTMRLVRSDTAEVVSSVTAYRSIDTDTMGVTSQSRVAGGIYPDSLLQKYPTPSDYIQGEVSGSRSEMTQIALREAIEAALIDLVYRSAALGVWSPPQMAAASEYLPPPPALPSPPKAKLKRKATTETVVGEQTPSRPPAATPRIAVARAEVPVQEYSAKKCQPPGPNTLFSPEPVKPSC